MCQEDLWILDPLKMEPVCCPETSVMNYHYSLRNDPEEQFTSTSRWKPEIAQEEFHLADFNEN